MFKETNRETIKKSILVLLFLYYCYYFTFSQKKKVNKNRSLIHEYIILIPKCSSSVFVFIETHLKSLITLDLVRYFWFMEFLVIRNFLGGVSGYSLLSPGESWAFLESWVLVSRPLDVILSFCSNQFCVSSLVSTWWTYRLWMIN